jgi:hypothetical protein
MGSARAIQPERSEKVMNKASYVSIERGVCVVCGQKFDAGTLILEKHVAMDSCVVGWELCPADAQMHRLGFVAVVECDLDTTARQSGTTIAPNAVNRTGGAMHLTRDSFVSIFKTEARPTLPCAYVPLGTLQKLQALMHRALN